MGSYIPLDVKADILYIKWSPLFSTEKPFHSFIPIPEEAEDQRQTNVEYETRSTMIRDIRGQEADYTLDNNGICFRPHKLIFNNFGDIEAVQKSYLPEVERIIRSEVEGVTKIHFFSWRCRSSREVGGDTVINLNNPASVMLPSIHAHIDQAPSAALHNVLNFLPEEASQLLKGRLRIINVWRPYKNPVESWPLAFCEGGRDNISYADLLETDHVQRTFVGPSMNLMYKPGRRWVYLHGQTRDEVAIFKNFDSNSSVQARCKSDHFISSLS